MCIPNSNALGWEADLLSITGTGMVHEYEIKATASDLRADAKKSKHKHFEGWLLGERTHQATAWGYDYESDILQPPNYFWYVVPDGLKDKVEDQRFGIIVYHDQHSRGVEVYRRAKRLHKTPATPKMIQQISRSMMFRFWSQRQELTTHKQTQQEDI